MYKIAVTISLITLIPVIQLSGQTLTLNPYSKTGLGLLENVGNISNPGMGGSTLWMSNRNALNISNPASLSLLDTLTFVLEMGIKNQFSYMSIPGASRSTSQANLNYFSFGFRGTKHWTAGISLIPITSRGYKILDRETASTIGTIDKYYVGSGGLNAIAVANNFDITPDFSAGISVRYLFGKLEETNTLILQNIGTSYNTQQGIKDQISDFDYQIGLRYRIPDAENSSYSIGVVFTPKSNISGKRNSIKGTTKGTNLWSTDDNIFIDIIAADTNKTISYDKPFSIALGIGKTIMNRYSYGIDYTFQNWESTNFENTKNLHRIAAGISYIPQWNSATSYFKRTTYKFGAFFESSNIRVKETNINIAGIGVGVGMPIKRGIYSLDIDCQLGQMGTHTNDQIKDFYARMSLKFRFSEIWFYKPKYD